MAPEIQRKKFTRENFDGSTKQSKQKPALGKVGTQGVGVLGSIVTTETGSRGGIA
jgi:hypothetical protein